MTGICSVMGQMRHNRRLVDDDGCRDFLKNLDVQHTFWAGRLCAFE